MGLTNYKLLQLAVVLSAICLMAIQAAKRSSAAYRRGYYTMTMQDSPRNERSTPRSFVLPATPGVAFEQERQRTKPTPGMVRCLSELASYGYEVGSNEAPNNELTEAIYRFQADHRIAATGHLDETTRRFLKCL